VNDQELLDRALKIGLIIVIGIAIFWTLFPFLAPIAFAVVLASSSWQLFQWVLKFFKSPTPAAGAVTLLYLLVLALPLIIVLPNLSGQIRNVIESVQELRTTGKFSEAPQFIKDLPLVGPLLTSRWRRIARADGEILSQAQPYLEKGGSLLLGLGASLGSVLFDLVVALLFTFIFLRDGKFLGGLIKIGAEKIAGSEALKLVDLSEKTLKAVFYGVLGSSFFQAIAAYIGFKIAGISSAALLSLLVFFFGLLPIGPVLVWLPVVLYFFATGDALWGLFIFLWGALIVGSVDNIAKPLLIGKDCGLSFALIVIGVTGGAMQFGFLGIFLGPTFLALGYRILFNWLDNRSEIIQRV
jgi:predicted PurR-regulated permease PerM